MIKELSSGQKKASMEYFFESQKGGRKVVNFTELKELRPFLLEKSRQGVGAVRGSYLLPGSGT